MIYFDLLIGFLKVGLFVFGGGYGAIPLIRDVVLSYGWIGDEMLTYMIAVSESSPGSIMVNLATYVGSAQAGFWGALIATTAVALPSFIIVLRLMLLLNRLLKNPYAQAVLQGLKPCIISSFCTAVTFPQTIIWFFRMLRSAASVTCTSPAVPAPGRMASSLRRCRII